MRRVPVPHFKQRKDGDCGTVCAQMLYAYYTGKKVPLSALKKALGKWPREGVHIWRLAAFFQERGFATTILAAPRSLASWLSLRTMPSGDITALLRRRARKHLNHADRVSAWYQIMRYIRAGGVFKAQRLRKRDVVRELKKKHPPILVVDSVSFYWGTIDGGTFTHAIIPIAANLKRDRIIINDPNQENDTRYFSMVMRACGLSSSMAALIRPQ